MYYYDLVPLAVMAWNCVPHEWDGYQRALLHLLNYQLYMYYMKRSNVSASCNNIRYLLFIGLTLVMCRQSMIFVAEN